ncbi:hypothetical protein DL771_004156 [Monosporascus sp. 5C6A]|nr:hypothetical protein DL771_004156 [Monosporascus sp. 5C6A]
MSVALDYNIPFTTFHNVINNELTDTPTMRHTICPSTEEPLWNVPVSTQEDVDRAVSAAKAAFPGWSKLSQDERADYLNKFADAIEANKEEFIELLGKEVGKPPQAGSFELSLVMGLARETPKLRLKEEKVIDDADRTAIVRYVPLGVGVGIVPWNFPLTLGVGKLFPALLAGNTFIWKPSPYSPYSALKLAELGTSFTGSVATGKKVMVTCASTLKRVTLELGGNDAAIICNDVDIDAVVAKICMNIKRIYVHESIYDEFLAAMIAVTKQFKTGDHTDPEAFFGPIQNSMQYGKLQEFYSQIGKEGWKTALGGEPRQKEGKGFYMPPTIIDNPPENSSIVVDEPFGPIIPILKWTEEEDVIKRANASNLGLGASVWSKDVPRAQRMAEQLQAGSIWVNTHFELAPNVPFGGHKQSGLGMDWGELGLQGWCNPQAYWVKYSG